MEKANPISMNRLSQALSADLGFYRWIVVLNATVPCLVLMGDALRGKLGANAANQALHITGILSLVFLFLSLAVTPLKYFTGWASLIAFRRALGLSGFAYAMLHLGIYYVYDRNLDLVSTLSEILSRRFLQVGIIAVLLMIPLAITSTNGMIRRLGAKRWKLLHRAAYLAAILGVLHYYLLVKSDVRQPIAFAAVLAPLLGFRIFDHFRSRSKPASRAPIQAESPSPANQNRRNKIWKGMLTVGRIIDETHDVKTFRLILPTEQNGEMPFQHAPGQFLSLQLMIDGKVFRRSYTISSSPSQRAYCEITVKRDGVASQYLHSEIEEGSQLEVSAPAGKFTFWGAESNRLCLIAGGVGITPLMSIARWLHDCAWPGEIDFVMVAHAEADLIFDQELALLAKRNSKLRLHYVLTRAMESSRKAHLGRITATFLQQSIPDLRSIPIYLCGPTPMMDATKSLLADCGVPADHVRTEAFAAPKNSVEVAKKEISLDKPSKYSSSLHNATSADITFVPGGVTFSGPAGMTILEAGEEAGVSIPFECRSGICGQCKLRCESGSVEMNLRDALSDRELKEGYILACQATPTSPQLSIRLP